MNETEFVALVRRMRAAQKNYFRTQAAARNTGNGDLFKEAKEYLVESKNLEKQVDAFFEPKILNEFREEPPSEGMWNSMKKAYDTFEQAIESPAYLPIRLLFTVVLTVLIISPEWLILSYLNDGIITPSFWTSFTRELWLWSLPIVSGFAWLLSGSSFEIKWGGDVDEEEEEE